MAALPLGEKEAMGGASAEKIESVYSVRLSWYKMMKFLY